MIKTSVSGVDDVQKAIQDFVESLDAPYVTVGIHEGVKEPKGGDINMATLGAIQHFGNDHIPARPWLDAGVESGNDEYQSIIEDAIAEGESLSSAMNQVGIIATGKVQQFITQLKSPPNASSTIAKKGSSNPLIDTGAMRASVSHQISDEKPGEGI